MGWSKKNLHDVKDYAVDFGLDETQEAHFGRKDLDLEATGFNYLVVKPGRREAFGHRHSQAEEVIVVLDGEGGSSSTTTSSTSRPSTLSGWGRP